jgi:hypothetical protein
LFLVGFQCSEVLLFPFEDVLERFSSNLFECFLDLGGEDLVGFLFEVTFAFLALTVLVVVVDLAAAVLVRFAVAVVCAIGGYSGCYL